MLVLLLVWLPFSLAVMASDCDIASDEEAADADLERWERNAAFPHSTLGVGCQRSACCLLAGSLPTFVITCICLRVRSVLFPFPERLFSGLVRSNILATSDIGD